ncbi:sensor histidine kinase [Labilithrix luteola]|uniref:histidine kinase n=1 Tax=Labilithrix luteola TaxID=1391654 RepID=A0A0K1PK80_9BACT|nr:HAMP domain-containing sensor histidine kinase [Labilithrix luteola]AKU93948.1 sensor histidine kinase [Labilithrix luteola]
MAPSTYALLSLWASTLAVGFSALRMGRGPARVLALPSILLGAWVTGLLLLQTGTHDALAERLLPFGMLLAGAFVQAASTLSGGSKRLVRITWAAAFAVALLGLAAPRLLYGPGARGAGPVFWPLGAVCALGSGSMQLWHLSMIRRAPASERLLRGALFTANLFAALGGACAIALYVTGLAPLGFATAPLFVSVVASAVAVHQAEPPRVRAMIVQSFVLGLGTAALTAFALAAMYALLPRLAPGAEAASPLLVLVLFVLALPLDPLRQALVDRAAVALFRRPIAARELSVAIETEEARADHAERLAELGRMASAVAHEIRNPLGVVLAEAKLLEREGASAESIEAIRNEVGRARRFMDDLLRYAKPRPLEPAVIDLREAVERGGKRALLALGESERRLSLRRASDDEPRVDAEADADAISDVVANLVSNALIATSERPGGSVTVTIETSPDAHAIVVEDDGPGVPAEIEPRLFTAFTTGRGRDAKHPGTGLGLAITARLVERHGGTLRHERPQDGGARFVVTFPRFERNR